MNYLLKNEYLALTVTDAGAEMKSLINLSDDTELLWNGDKQYWGRTAPVLFPLVGRVKDDHYTENNSIYEMHQHGFARDSKFEMIEKSSSMITFSLRSSADTLKVYPYEFELRISYVLADNSLKIIWKVINPTDDDIYFSIGGHPGFMCPVNNNESQTDYYFELDCMNDSIICNSFDSGYVTDKPYTVSLNNRKLNITSNLFDNDALVIENNQIHRVSLNGPDNHTYLTLESDAPVFGLWSPPKKNAPFVCIEPWYGRCDSSNYNGEWKDRKFSNKLTGHNTFSGGFTLTL